eukprot:CAMPEP_0170564654 /NCGR_PEP_ID=MMETSP0211-20121228/74155_1 /TAXON_ID=311385 /ORGANISM="Pseudokeronopsis sp., Strain OXSARD2" /LENGTH=36 /DNA_ID= /DNA_START= /DNA_END= /DNA_ORIENTATION=
MTDEEVMSSINEHMIDLQNQTQLKVIITESLFSDEI